MGTSTRSKILVVLAASVVAAVAVFIGLFFMAYGGDPPGVGPKAESGYAACRPVISALFDYQHEQGQFPERLEDLSPKYLKHVPLTVHGRPLLYQRKHAAFELIFRYTGPGTNWCEYSSASRRWECSGAY